MSSAPPQLTTLSAAGTLTLAVVAMAADTFSLIGIGGSMRVFVVSAAAAVAVSASLLVARRMRQYRRDIEELQAADGSLMRIRQVRMQDVVDRAANEPALEVLCMGSGSETYLNLMVDAVRKGVVTPRTQVRVGFRMTPAGPRDAKLLHFGHRWNVLITEQRLSVTFHPPRQQAGQPRCAAGTACAAPRGWTGCRLARLGGGPGPFAGLR
jgi:hypothetical protein